MKSKRPSDIIPVGVIQWNSFNDLFCHTNKLGGSSATEFRLKDNLVARTGRLPANIMTAFICNIEQYRLPCIKIHLNGQQLVVPSTFSCHGNEANRLCILHWSKWDRWKKLLPSTSWYDFKAFSDQDEFIPWCMDWLVYPQYHFVSQLEEGKIGGIL